MTSATGMSSRYFTPRRQIMAWVNRTLGTELQSIEELGSGTLYCYLLDSAFPGKVALHKLKQHPQLEIEFIHNLRVLQSCFEHLGIDKEVDIARLSKAKYLDNLEFIQWFKGAFQEAITENALLLRPKHKVPAPKDKENRRMVASKQTLSTLKLGASITELNCMSKTSRLTQSKSSGKILKERPNCSNILERTGRVKEEEEECF